MSSLPGIATGGIFGLDSISNCVSKFSFSDFVKLYKRENSKYWQMKIKLPKQKAIRSSTGSKILKDAEKIALKYYSTFIQKTKISFKKSRNSGYN